MMARISQALGNKWDGLNNHIRQAHTTNLKLFSAIACGIATVIMYWVVCLFDKTPEYVTFGMLLTFITTWLFDGRKQFEIKRKTEWMPEGVEPPAKQIQESIDYRRKAGEEDGTEPI